jgi:hypothetical protein
LEKSTGSNLLVTIYVALFHPATSFYERLGFR